VQEQEIVKRAQKELSDLVRQPLARVEVLSGYGCISQWAYGMYCYLWRNSVYRFSSVLWQYQEPKRGTSRRGIFGANIVKS
jgi:hypothetical protein